jgi:hypothetical protein
MGTTTLQGPGVVGKSGKSWIGEHQSAMDDERILIWEKGKEAGKKEVLNGIESIIEKGIGRLHKAQEACEKMWSYMESKEISPLGLYMKSVEMSSFIGLFVIEKSRMEELEAKGVYDKKYSIIDPLAKKDFDLDMRFISYSEGFDPRKVNIDGFSFTYTKTKIIIE